VHREEVLETIWPDVSVTDGSLKTAIHAIRRALGESGPDKRFIATQRGRSYRFCAAVRIVPALLTLARQLANEARQAGFAVRASRACGRADLECYAHRAGVYIALIRGDRSAADLAWAELRALLQRMRTPTLQVVVTATDVVRLQRDSQLDTALARIGDVAALHRELHTAGVWSTGLVAHYQWWHAFFS